ncbi:MAG: tetratricopeptide repeat protein [Planctomycetaceae bacterium]
MAVLLNSCAGQVPAKPAEDKPANVTRDGQPLAVVVASTIAECTQLLLTGQYAECLQSAAAAIENRRYGEEWPLLKAESEMRLGRYQAAAETIVAGTERYSWSIRLRMLAWQNFQVLGDREGSERMLGEVNSLVSTAPWRYTDADDLVAMGRAAIVLGADPKAVLEGFFDRARKNYSSRSDGWTAAGELAISKGDPALALDILNPAAEKFPDDPEVLYLLSEAVRSSDSQHSAELLQQTLQINPRHQKALQRIAERQIDAEDYDAAEVTIGSLLEINPHQPEAHALQAVIHHLRNQPDEAEKSCRQACPGNIDLPAVNHLIGTQLSRKYRFREAADYQRKALATDPNYLPAMTQLSQDLLRLGMDEEGWRLADEAQKKDQYSTTLFNLMELKDTLNEFTELKSEHFVVRMHRSEAAIYGSRVEQLLNEGFDVLSEKYGYVPAEPIIVEIFHRQDDFAVRTFGLPDVAGFLGVCFGRVITANSPASQKASPNNWQSVLWHEFCHVITLQMTQNRIPRWLSEGISVYEERVRDRRWGQSMSPTFRERVRRGDITPVSELSSAFLTAKSGADLNFAYYESSMVVEFLVREHGFETLLKVLQSLNDGLVINDALDRHTGGLENLDAGFEAYLHEVAEQFAPGVDFTVADESAGNPASPEDADSSPEDKKTNPAVRNYTLELQAAAQLVKAGQLAEASEVLKSLVELFPEDPGHSGARPLLATVLGRQGKTDEQIAVLTKHLEYTADDLPSALQLLTLRVDGQQWPEAVKTGQLVMAIDPLQPEATRQLLQAASKTDDSGSAIQLLHAVLELEPADAARTHFQLAELQQASDPVAARRHVLLALEQAPRYREAHQLLLKLVGETKNDNAAERRSK